MKAGLCFYMTGLTDLEFNCLFDCVKPYLSYLIHPDSKCNGSGNRKMDIKTELMAFMTILRHAFHLGIIAWMTNTSIATPQSAGKCISKGLISKIFYEGMPPDPPRSTAM